MSTALSSVELLAVTKAVATKIAKEAREGVAPGEYELSFDAHIEGTVRVGEDYEQRIVGKADPWKLLTAALAENARLAAAAGEAGIDIGKLVKLAEAVDPDLEKNTKRQAESEAAAIKAETLTPCKGKVTADLSVTPVTS